VVSDYALEAGDIVWLQFDLQASHEQAGHRAALVPSPAKYNTIRGIIICFPMTSKTKGYRFEVIVTQTPPRALLSDQTKSLDWLVRQASVKGGFR